MINTALRLLDLASQYVVRETKRRDVRDRRETLENTRSDPQSAFADRFTTGVYGNTDPIAMPGDAAEPAECDLRTGPDPNP